MPPPKSCLISSGINQRRKQISYSVLNNYTRGRTFWWKRIQVILYGNNTWIWCSNHLMSSFFPLMQTKIPTTTDQNFESQVCWVCGVFLTEYPRTFKMQQWFVQNYFGKCYAYLILRKTSISSSGTQSQWNPLQCLSEWRKTQPWFSRSKPGHVTKPHTHTHTPRFHDISENSINCWHWPRLQWSKRQTCYC